MLANRPLCLNMESHTQSNLWLQLVSTQLVITFTGTHFTDHKFQFFLFVCFYIFFCGSIIAQIAIWLIMSHLRGSVCVWAHVTSSAGCFVLLTANTKEPVFRSLGREIVLSSDSPAIEGEGMVTVLDCSFEAFFSTTTFFPLSLLLEISICVLTLRHLLYYPPRGSFFSPPSEL